MVAWPFLVLILARKPCLFFCTRLDGLNVLRGAPTSADAENSRICNDGPPRVDVFVDVLGACGSLGWDMNERAEKPRDRVVIADGDEEPRSEKFVLVNVVGALLMVENALLLISLVHGLHLRIRAYLRLGT